MVKNEPVMKLAVLLAGALAAVGVGTSAPVLFVVLSIVLPIVVGLVQRSKVVPASAIKWVEDELEIPDTVKEDDEPKTATDAPAAEKVVEEPEVDPQSVPLVADVPSVVPEVKPGE